MSRSNSSRAPHPSVLLGSALSGAVIALAACAGESRDPAPPPPEPGDTIASGEGGAPPGPAAPTCDGPGPAAPEGTPVCGFDAVCDADADCAAHAGTYCQHDLCASQGCLRGGCLLTKVQGQACSRDGECVSGKCQCSGDACTCGPEDGPYDLMF